jgi:hypothetical protein
LSGIYPLVLEGAAPFILLLFLEVGAVSACTVRFFCTFCCVFFFLFCVGIWRIHVRKQSINKNFFLRVYFKGDAARRLNLNVSNYGTMETPSSLGALPSPRRRPGNLRRVDLRDLDSITDPEVLVKRLTSVKDVEIFQKIGKGNFGNVLPIIHFYVK